MALEVKEPLSEAWNRGGSVETWSRIIHSRDALPAPFDRAAGWLIDKELVFPYIVFAPRLMGTRRRTAERLAALTGEAIYIWERAGRQVLMTAYPLATISAVEVGDILLYSWLTIAGLTNEGVAGATTVEFNTVSLSCFQPFISRLRPAPAVETANDWPGERDKFNYLESISYKFMSFARASLLPGGVVIDHLWQPGIQQHVLTVLGHSFSRPVSEAHITILTDKEVILIGEDERTARLSGGRYGSVRCYVPLEHIGGLSIAARGQNVVTLVFRLLPDERQVEKLYDASAVDKVERFRAALESRLGQQQVEKT